MNKKTIFKISTVAFFIGIVLIVIGVALGGLTYISATDIDELPNPNKAEDARFTNDFYREDLADFSSLDLRFSHTDLEIKQSANNQAYFECSNIDKKALSVQVVDNRLEVIQSARKRFKIFRINFLKNVILNGINVDRYSNKFVLYLPKKSFDTVFIDSSYSDIDISNINASSLDVKLNYGDLSVVDGTSNNTDLNNNMGNIKINNLVSSEKLEISTDMGDTKVDTCGTSKLKITSNMGDISFKKLKAEKSIEILNDMGDIDVEIIIEADKYYNIDVNNSMGNVAISDKLKNSDRLNEAEVMLRIESDMGDVKIDATDE